jgi:hypothetical protein
MLMEDKVKLLVRPVNFINGMMEEIVLTSLIVDIQMILVPAKFATI